MSSLMCIWMFKDFEKEMTSKIIFIVFNSEFKNWLYLKLYTSFQLLYSYTFKVINLSTSKNGS